MLSAVGVPLSPVRWLCYPEINCQRENIQVNKHMLSDLIKQNVYILFKYETISVYFLLCILILLSEV